MSQKKLVKISLPISETMFYILFALMQERYGYEIMQYVQTLTNKRICLGAGTVYQTISKLEKWQLIQATKEVDRRKSYIITNNGSSVLRDEALRINELHKITKEIVK